MIKAPFNFVPLSEKVYFPEWADRISHDVPFEDGMSGAIKIKIASSSPIFIRNGHSRKDKEEETDTYLSSARMPNGQYYIPGTSLKGAIRSVFEILTASKITIVKNSSFGIRELSGGDSQFYREKIKPEQVRCGWLRCEGDQYLLDDCGIPKRIGLDEIDNKLGIGLEEFAKQGNFKVDENRTAKAKYVMSEGCDLHGYFEDDEELKENLSVGNRQFVKFSHNGFGGTIVFTGQPGNRKRDGKLKKNGEKAWTGKYFEFVFPDEVESSDIVLPESLVNEFLSIHKNSPDYKDFWKNKLDDGARIPVFFTLKKDGYPDAIGLSYMFKFPAFNSVFSALREDDLKTDKMDMTECVFGKTGESFSLKGRVQFSNALCISEAEPIPTQEFVLSTPHPSYYPLYLGKGQTWNSEKIQIAGRKRYPVREKIARSTDGTQDMKSKMRPLPKDLVFETSVHFFNLKPMELGALIAALTFNGKSECYHSIGAGKPYGLGKCKIDIVDISIVNNNMEEPTMSMADLVCSFNNVVCSYQDNNSLEELYAMAQGVPAGREDTFTYMQMSTTPKINEFVDGKKEYEKGQQLGKFTEIVSGNVPKTQLAGNVASNKQRVNIEEIMKREAQARIEAEEKRIAMQEKEIAYATLLSDALNAEQVGNYNEAISKAEEAHKIFENRPEPNNIIIRNRSLASQHELEEEKAAQEAAATAARNDKYGRSLGEVLAGTKYVSQELAKWTKVDGNDFGDREYGVLLEVLRLLDAKQMKVAIKSKKDVIKAIGDNYASRLFAELGIK